MIEGSERFLRLPDVLARTGLSRATIYRKMEQGTFPKNFHIARWCVGWRESAINEWLHDPMIYRAPAKHSE